MKIDLLLLRKSLDRLLTHAASHHGDSVEIDADFYWFVSKEELTDPAATPAQLTLGSYEDDWAALAAIATHQRDEIGYALVWASSILRAIGDRTR